VELRGLEPQRFPAKTASEEGLLASGVVTPYASFLRICVGVLRDVTVPAVYSRPLGYELRTGSFLRVRLVSKAQVNWGPAPHLLCPVAPASGLVKHFYFYCVDADSARSF
jgi:hypothetical protein